MPCPKKHVAWIQEIGKPPEESQGEPTTRSKMMLDRLRIVACHIGEDELGFKAKEAGAHSLCSGAAMAMCLAGAPAFTIALVGRWPSDTFL